MPHRLYHLSQRIMRPSRRWAEKRFSNIVFWNEPERGGTSPHWSSRTPRWRTSATAFAACVEHSAALAGTLRGPGRCRSSTPLDAITGIEEGLLARRPDGTGVPAGKGGRVIERISVSGGAGLFEEYQPGLGDLHHSGLLA